MSNARGTNQTEIYTQVVSIEASKVAPSKKTNPNAKAPKLNPDGIPYKVNKQPIDQSQVKNVLAEMDFGKSTELPQKDLLINDRSHYTSFNEVE